MTCNTCKANKVCDHNKYGFENCGNYIPKDVVGVVRCKDCKYFRKEDDCRIARCMIHRTLMFDIDFCSSGERKDT